MFQVIASASICINLHVDTHRCTLELEACTNVAMLQALASPPLAPIGYLGNDAHGSNGLIQQKLLHSTEIG